MAIHQDQTKPSYEQLLAQLAETQARLAQAQAPKALTMKVTEANPETGKLGGAISIYGLQRFPVTLYRSQWERLLAAKPEIEAFIRVNAARLATKA